MFKGAGLIELAMLPLFFLALPVLLVSSTLLMFSPLAHASGRPLFSSRPVLQIETTEYTEGTPNIMTSCKALFTLLVPWSGAVNEEKVVSVARQQARVFHQQRG
jgi:hypothetical protein